MASTAYAVPLSRVVAQGVRIELPEAVAILDAIWAVVAGTRDAEGRCHPLPAADDCLLTAFGDLEVQRAVAPAAASRPASDLTAGLCRWLWNLMTSGRANARGLPADVVELLRAVEGQRRVGGHVAFGTPEELLAACAGARVSDGSAALAHLYARWEIASTAEPESFSASLGTSQPRALQAPPEPASATTANAADRHLYTPAILDPGNATLKHAGASDAASAGRPSRRTGPSARVAAAVATAAMVAVLAAGVARVRRTSTPDVPATSTALQVSAAHVDQKRVPRLVAQAPILDATSLPDPGPISTGSTVLDGATPQRDALATAASSAPRRLVRATDVGATPYSPSFARSTGSLMFHAGQGQTGLHEASLRADGTVDQVRTLMRDGARSYHVQMSPDGTQMAFDSDRDGVRGVYVANRDGSRARRVSGGGTALVPSWSPDGSRLAFVRAEAGRPRVWQLWTVVLSTNRLHQHTFHRVGQPWGGSWFPDGHRLAYSLEDRLMVLDIRSGERRAYASPLPGRLVRTPAVSPGGDRIAFQVRQDGMWMLNVASGHTTRILSDRSAQEFAWSPDGRLVAYHSARGGAWEIWAVPVGGL